MIIIIFFLFFSVNHSKMETVKPLLHDLVYCCDGVADVSLSFPVSLQDEVKRTGETGVEETILEGHLGVTKELLAFQTPEKKYYIGCEKGGANLIKVSRCTHTPTVCSGKAVENTAVVQCRVSPSLGMSGHCWVMPSGQSAARCCTSSQPIP